MRRTASSKASRIRNIRFMSACNGIPRTCRGSGARDCCSAHSSRRRGNTQQRGTAMPPKCHPRSPGVRNSVLEEAVFAHVGGAPLKRIALAVALAVLLMPQAYAGPWLKSLATAQQKAKDGNKLI